MQGVLHCFFFCPVSLINWVSLHSINTTANLLPSAWEKKNKATLFVTYWCYVFLHFLPSIFLSRGGRSNVTVSLPSSLCEKRCAKLCTNPFWLTGGFGTYLFGMSETIAKQATEADNPQNVKNPHIGWMIGFLFLVSFIGLFALVPLRKVNVSIRLCAA